MRATGFGLLLSMLTFGGLGLAPSEAEAQLLPWRRPRYATVVVYSAPPAYAPAPVVSYYYAPPVVSYYYAPPATFVAPLPAAATTPYAYGPALVPAASPYVYGPAPAAAGAGYGYAATQPPASASSYTSTSAYYQPAAAGPAMNVSVHDNNFQPGTINVFVGTTVAWHNDSGTPHTVTSDTGLFDSREIRSGMSFRYTFNQPGTYPYHCAIHPQMRGTIVVQ
jgi:plastocyanin